MPGHFAWVRAGGFSLLLCLAPAAFAAAQPDMPRVASLVAERTNDFRRGEGLQPLERSDSLEAAARAFADFMAKTEKYGHEADASTPSARAKRHGFDYCIVSENIAYHYNSQGFTTPDLARNVVEGWKKSPGHRKNMLDRDVTQSAVAVARGARNGYYYAVQMFGRPKSDSIQFQVRNASAAPARYRIGDETYTVPPRGVRSHLQCRAEALALERPRDDNSKAGQYTPRNGDRFVVVGDRNQAALRRE